MPGIERRTNDAHEPKTLGAEAYESITGTITCIRTRNGDDDKLSGSIRCRLSVAVVESLRRVTRVGYPLEVSFEESKRTTR